MTRVVADPTYLSWHYTIRSADGHIAQHVRAKDIGWHAGNWYVNSPLHRPRARGLPGQGRHLVHRGDVPDVGQAGAATSPRKYDIPLDRAHILGHDNVPGTTPETVRGMHEDPGPYWDWAHYFDLLGRPLRASGGRGRALGADQPRTTPPTARASPAAPAGAARLPAHGASSVWLRTAPRARRPAGQGHRQAPDRRPSTTASTTTPPAPPPASDTRSPGARATGRRSGTSARRPGSTTRPPPRPPYRRPARW